MSPVPPSGDGLAVPFLVDPEHEDVAEHVAHERFFWLDLQGPTERQLEKLAKLFELHPLTIEDARKFGERPKLEEYDNYVFMVAYGVDPGTSSGGPLLREVHLIVSGRYVVTIHRRPFKALEELRERYDAHRVRSEQFLVYKILDAVTATFFPVLARIDDDIDAIEEEIVQDPNEEILRRIFSIKRDLVEMRQVVSPQRDVFARDAERIGDLRGMEADDRLSSARTSNTWSRTGSTRTGPSGSSASACWSSRSSASSSTSVTGAGCRRAITSGTVGSLRG